MARLLVVTCGTSTVPASHGVAAECSFTISNQAPAPVTAQLRVLPLDAPIARWFELTGGEHLTLGAGETRQVAIRILPQAMGDFLFRLDATPTAPAGERTIGPSVTLQVAIGEYRHQSSARPFPWLMVAVILLLLALAGGAFWLHERSSAASPAAPSGGSPSGRDERTHADPHDQARAEQTTPERIGAQSVEATETVDKAGQAERAETAEKAEKSEKTPSAAPDAHPDSALREQTDHPADEPAAMAEEQQAETLARSWFASWRQLEIDSMVRLSPPPFQFDQAGVATSAATVAEVHRRYLAISTSAERATIARSELVAVAISPAERPSAEAAISRAGVRQADLVATVSVRAGDQAQTITLFLRLSPSLHLIGMSR